MHSPGPGFGCARLTRRGRIQSTGKATLPCPRHRLRVPRRVPRARRGAAVFSQLIRASAVAPHFVEEHECGLFLSRLSRRDYEQLTTAKRSYAGPRLSAYAGRRLQRPSLLKTSQYLLNHDYLFYDADGVNNLVGECGAAAGGSGSGRDVILLLYGEGFYN